MRWNAPRSVANLFAGRKAARLKPIRGVPLAIEQLESRLLLSAVVNGSFETPVLTAGTSKADPTGATWTFAGASGIESNGSLSAPNAPNGTQAAYLDGNSSFSQVVNMTPGTYTVSFQFAAQQYSSLVNESIQFSVGGSPVGGTFTPASDTNFTLYHTAEFTITSAGNYTLKFAGTGGSGNYAFIDAVSLGTLQSISISPANPSLPTHGIEQFTATGTYSDGTTQNLSSVVAWTSSNAAIATISAGGLAATLAAGSDTITATHDGISGSTGLTATAATLESISVSPINNPSVAAGGIEQFTATGTYSDGSSENLTNVVAWTSLHTSFATILAGGMASALAAGGDTITATYAGINGSDGLTVTAAATPQLPNLLNGYDAIPSLPVAGVNYAVGIAGGTTLTDWETLSGPGITVSTASDYVSVYNTNNVTIQNVDFSLHGGARLYFVNCKNVTVQNCNFGGTNLATISSGVISADPQSSNFTVRNCVIDGDGAGTGACLIFYQGSGTVTLQYNWFKHFPQQVLEMVQGATESAVLNYSFNLIEDGAYQSGAHMNYLQWSSGTVTPTVAYNTSVQDLLPPSGGAGEGYQFYFNGSGGTMNSPVLIGNVMIATDTSAPGTVDMSYMVHGSASSTITGTPIVEDNYFDPSAAYGAFYTGSFPGWTFANNIDMVTGATINPDNSSFLAAPSGLTATDAGNGDVALSWTAAGGASSYDIYRSTTSGGEGGTPIKTGVTSTSYTNTGLTNGTQYFYQVTAVYPAAQSGASNEASATPLAADVWTGAASSVWSNPGNWSMDATPNSTIPTIINGGSVESNAAFNIGSLIMNGGTLQLEANTGTYSVTLLTINNGAALDLGNNELIVNFGSNPDPISTIEGYVQTGYNGGSWTGTGITSSAVAAYDASKPSAYGVAVADGKDGNVAGLSAGQLEITPALAGDANLDGTVDSTDLGILLANWQKTAMDWDEGDFNGDGKADSTDLGLLLANWQQTASSSVVFSLAAQLRNAVTFAEQQLNLTMTSDLDNNASLYPNYTNATTGAWVTQSAANWNSGSFPASLWQINQLTGNTAWETDAEKWSAGMVAEANSTSDDYINVYATFLADYEATGSAQARQAILTAAANRVSNFNAAVGAWQTTWRSSTSGNPAANFGVLLDQSMDSLEVFWAAAQTGNTTWYNDAVAEMNTVAKYLIRPNGSTWQWAYFNSTTGQFIDDEAYDAYSDSTTWSRGQAWAMYSFTNAYAFTGQAGFLTDAENLCNYFISNLPADSIPYWDFNAPGIPNTYRDTSAAAIAASALLQLAKIDPNAANAQKYYNAASAILTSLSGPNYLAEGSNSHGILLQGDADGAQPGGLYDNSLNYGDFYFLQAAELYLSYPA